MGNSERFKSSSSQEGFDRHLNGSGKLISIKGSCSLGGKAQGLVSMNEMLNSEFDYMAFPQIEVGIPAMSVLCTDIFEVFMERNKLNELAYSDLPDDRIAHAFQKAELPFEILGELRGLIDNVHSPLAIRSSSLLEDSTHEPFAGVYTTKMTPNNQFDPNIRFRKLIEAIKLVFASTYFKSAKGYQELTKHSPEDEKMAVIIQEVVGKRITERFYPELSGVIRSYNFYPIGRAKNEDGVVNLALGLGKTIVDGEISWAYSPSYPEVSPPYRSVGDLLKNSQNTFWAINMGSPELYDPIKETEYLISEDILTAERDGSLRYLVSTFDIQSGRLTMGMGKPGPRVLNFSPLLRMKEIPLNDLIKSILPICERCMDSPVEIEFAMTFNPHRFGFLQVRPMVVSTEGVEIDENELVGEDVLIASKEVLGHGFINNVHDIVYVRPDRFETKHTRQIASEIEELNRNLIKDGRVYLLVVFGRLGSFDPWLGIPVNWGQISGAGAIVEATLENIHVELSQGSHFFHNLTSLGICYFSVPFSGSYKIDWAWLDNKESVNETMFLRHVRTDLPLKIKIDGRKGIGMILKSDSQLD